MAGKYATNLRHCNKGAFVKQLTIFYNNVSDKIYVQEIQNKIEYKSLQTCYKVFRKNGYQLTAHAIVIT